ncbi:MAG: hypothetical protein A2X25_04745 [Chloroflexi bacterium GWB2_49_20]|nr:MAG: hypothetical protein A2X25_04745 [Chloroflexi bacterium GWB2_49_20]OGN80496.1 MAG: hypothetical protein A2X26_11855 [Chloroflexi bacterium GWC2_49_37]OGN83331.1 MAG: hypothetical protein A2X27_12030 [Chloroflexi bacterium GWD2_49_16]
MLGVLLVIFSFSEIENIVKTLKHSDWRFWGLALVVELIWLYNLATSFRALYRLMGIKEDSRHLFWVASAANFINVVAPSAGIGGMALFLDDAKRRNHPTGHVTVVGALFVLYDYCAFLCVLALGWVVLIRRNNLNAGEITASFILLGLAIGLTLLLYLGYKSGDALGRALMGLVRLINRLFNPFIHRPYLSEESARRYAFEISDSLMTIKGKRREMIWPFLFALNNKALLLIILALSFLTYQVPFTAGTLVAGLSIAYLFVIVSPTPAGLGFVEGALTIALNAMRVPLGSAAVITLTYRAVTFWFPLAVGALALRHLHISRKPDGQVEVQDRESIQG